MSHSYKTVAESATPILTRNNNFPHHPDPSQVEREVDAPTTSVVETGEVVVAASFPHWRGRPVEQFDEFEGVITPEEDVARIMCERGCDWAFAVEEYDRHLGGFWD